jgi:FkbM family methyltransferase
MGRVRPLVNRVLPRESVEVRVRSGLAEGLRLQIDPQSQKYYWHGNWAMEIQLALKELLRPGMTFWDAGAHYGFLALIGSRLVGQTGRVVAFEPIPANYEKLKNHLAINNAANVSVEPVALSAHVGSAEMTTEHGESSTWTLKGPPVDGAATVQLSTLDEQLAKHEPPDVIKVDVEGAEIELLRGGAELIRRHRPVVIIEILSRDGVPAVQEMLPGYAPPRTLGPDNYLFRPA